MKRAILTTASLLVGLGAAVPVMAQGGGPGPDRPPHARSCDDMNARLAGQLAFTETKLKITDQQRAAWTAYAGAMKANQADRVKVCQDMEAKHKERAEQAAKAPKDEKAEKGERRGPHHPPVPPMPVTERVAKMEEHAAAQLKYVQTLRPAVTALYGQLSPEQKVDADRLLVRGEGMFAGHRGKHHGPMGPRHGAMHDRGHGGPGGHGAPGGHGPQGGPDHKAPPPPAPGVPPKG